MLKSGNIVKNYNFRFINSCLERIPYQDQFLEMFRRKRNDPMNTLSHSREHILHTGHRGRDISSRLEYLNVWHTIRSERQINARRLLFTFLTSDGRRLSDNKTTGNCFIYLSDNE